MRKHHAALAATAAALTLTGCGEAPEGKDPIPFAPVFGRETPAPEPTGHTINHQEKSTFGRPPTITAWTVEWPDGTASWCVSHTGTHCKDIPEGWTP